MATKHTIEVTITPLCTACGAELETGCLESKPSSGPFDRDWPGGRKDQRLFVYACEKCYVFKGDLPKPVAELETRACAHDWRPEFGHLVCVKCAECKPSGNRGTAP